MLMVKIICELLICKRKHCVKSEAVAQRCSVKKLFLEILAGLGLQLCQKRVPGTGVFLWILRNFQECLFLQNTSGGCFCKMCQNTVFLWPYFSVLQKTRISCMKQTEENRPISIYGIAVNSPLSFFLAGLYMPEILFLIK